MSTPRPVVDERARAALDSLPQCLSVAHSIRRADGAIEDFRLVFVNAAAADWAGMDRATCVGRLATDFGPAIRTTGLLESLVRVIEYGEPLFVAAGAYDGELIPHRGTDGLYDLGAIRHGDGYVSAWRQLRSDDASAVSSTRDLRDSLEMARDVVPLVRLE